MQLDKGDSRLQVTIGTPKEQAHRNTPRRKKYYPSSQSYFYKYFTINVGHTYTNYQTNKKNKGQEQQIKESKRRQTTEKIPENRN